MPDPVVAQSAEAEGVIKRLSQRGDVLSRALTVAVAAFLVLAGAFVVLASAYFSVRDDTDTSAKLLRVSQCRTEKDIAVELLKDDPARTPLALELVDPSTPPAERQQIAEEFTRQAERIADLQRERLNCGRRA